MVRSPGFEPGSSAWEAEVLPSWTTTAMFSICVLGFKGCGVAVMSVRATSVILLMFKPGSLAFFSSSVGSLTLVTVLVLSSVLQPIIRPPPESGSHKHTFYILESSSGLDHGLIVA